VIQQLFGEALGLQSVLALTDGRVRERIMSMVDAVDRTVRQLRMTVFALQGPVGDPHGTRARLVTALTAATGALGFEPTLLFDGPIESLEPATADDLIDVLSTALSYIAAHAHADAAVVDVVVGRDLTLTVTDNGTPTRECADRERVLAKMSDQARRRGGDCAITNQPPSATCLTWRVPTRSRANAT
jgi:signal transduction histidine kinase